MSREPVDVAYIDVIVDVPAVGDRRFTYLCPPELSLPVGAKVRVPFGQTMVEGFVAGKPLDPPQMRLKPVQEVYDMSFLPPPELLDLCADLAGYYCAPVASLWSCLYPPVAPKKPVDRIMKEGLSAASPVGEVELSAPAAGMTLASRLREVPAQLIWGDTRYRWDLYLEEIADTLNRGKSVLFLIPEIKGMREAMNRLAERFPGEVLAVHSEMTGVTRREAWLALVRGSKRLAVGTRSAVFAPMPGLGLIIVEDESSDSYKSPERPFYDARTVALSRALYGAKVVFGAAYPSVDSVWNSSTAGWECRQSGSSLERALERELLTVDLRGAASGKVLISDPLAQELERAFSEGKRAVLFLNRRGESTQVLCQECGTVISCPKCGVPLSYHSGEKEMVCHTCGMRDEPPMTCPTCGGHRWRMAGYGVEKVEAEFAKRFPNVPVFRLDRDVAKKRLSGAALDGFAGAAPSCLVATQMVLGQSMPPGISVVAALSADTALNLPDFRASEKAYQVLARFGDMVEQSGVFVVQTKNPDHHAVRGIGDSAVFYETELQNRRMLGYPPFKRFFKVRFGGRTFSRVEEAAVEFARKVPRDTGISVLGPVPAPKPKVRGIYWWQVALRGEDHDEMAAVCRGLLAEFAAGGPVKVLVDVDPIDME